MVVRDSRPWPGGSLPTRGKILPEGTEARLGAVFSGLGRKAPHAGATLPPQNILSGSQVASDGQIQTAATPTACRAMKGATPR